ncbi:MAG: cache domain-containing protein [Candidatus Omnitrophica bacterium]|nr:cache domain-containing protein [Candidatus Omnitrophota bacterium]
MKLNSLKPRIFLSFFSLIIVLGVSIAMLGADILKKDILEKAQQEVKSNLQTARSVYNNQIDSIRQAFELTCDNSDLIEFKRKTGLDYMYQISIDQKQQVVSQIALSAFEGKAIGGTRIIDKQELIKIDQDLAAKVKIAILATPKAIPTDKKILEQAMAIEYAMPIFDKSNRVSKIIYGGKIINRDFSLVDNIRNLVFQNKIYEGNPVGTVTIFQDDVRIATNVLTDKKQRAIGTRISEVVYNEVVKKRGTWVDRAFVVNAWYLTAYEPIVDIENNIIGMLYVGVLEKPFVDTERAIVFAFFTIICAAGVLAAILALILTAAITKPMTMILSATSKIASGDLQHRVQTNSPLKELRELADAFNSMSSKLDQREKSLIVSNNKLEVLNRNYLDLVGFVSHELKGILSSIVLNAYNLRKGFLGPMNEAQKKTLVSMSRNLDYLSATVKNFLNLSRIEKDEIMLKKTMANLKEQIFDVAIESFLQLAQEKNMTIELQGDPDIVINLDIGLIQIVVNNLLSNAIKYGAEGGIIRITTKVKNSILEVEVYNDGRPIASIDTDKLFKKFSRLIYAGMEKVKGTGIGLFITQKIIEQHGGEIWVEPKNAGNSFKFTIKIEEQNV